MSFHCLEMRTPNGGRSLVEKTPAGLYPGSSYIQGIVRHSESGIMRAHWTSADYAAMEQSPLPFAPTDIQLIQTGLAQRAARFGQQALRSPSKQQVGAFMAGYLHRTAVTWRSGRRAHKQCLDGRKLLSGTCFRPVLPAHLHFILAGLNFCALWRIPSILAILANQ
jgi:hypothetical protein